MGPPASVPLGVRKRLFSPYESPQKNTGGRTAILSRTPPDSTPMAPIFATFAKRKRVSMKISIRKIAYKKIQISASKTNTFFVSFRIENRRWRGIGRSFSVYPLG